VSYKAAICSTSADDLGARNNARHRRLTEAELQGLPPAKGTEWAAQMCSIATTRRKTPFGRGRVVCRRAPATAPVARLPEFERCGPG